MDDPGSSRHQIGSSIPQDGRGQGQVGPWTGAGLLGGGCLGCGYGFLVGLTAGIDGAISGFVVGGAIGLIAGPLTGFLIGLAQVLLRRTAIPAPVTAAAVTEFMLLPPQILAAGIGRLTAEVFIYIPSALAIGTATALGFLLPPAKSHADVVSDPSSKADPLRSRFIRWAEMPRPLREGGVAPSRRVNAACPMH